MAILLVFLALQFCDLATTMVFLRHGVSEANPLVAALMHVSAQPALAVLLVKAASCALAVYAWRSRRMFSRSSSRDCSLSSRSSRRKFPIVSDSG